MFNNHLIIAMDDNIFDDALFSETELASVPRDIFAASHDNNISVLNTFQLPALPIAETESNPQKTRKPKRKPTSRSYSNDAITQELFWQLINKALKDQECLLCLRTRLKNQSEKCGYDEKCDSEYTGATRHYKLFLHSVKHHHPVGQVVSQNLNKENSCILGCQIKKVFSSNRGLFEHIITKHICKELKKTHMLHLPALE